MTDRDEQRDLRRNGKTPSREVSRFQFDPPEARPAGKCSVTAETVPDVFISPSPCPKPTDPTRLIPGALNILNAELTLSCADVDGLGPEGDSVTLEKGAITRQVYFTEVEDITGGQLDRIARLTAEQLRLLAELTTTTASIVQLTSLKESQAEFFQARVAAVTLDVQAAALTAASAALSCFWYNEERTAVCPAGALTSPSYPEEGVDNPIVVAPRTLQSGLSQAEANQLADEQAELDLSCVWGNTEITVICEDIGYTEAVPNDEAIQGSATRLRVGSVTIEANTYFSQESRSEADAAATAQAELSLACFYINAVVVVDCEDEGFPGAVDSPVDAADNIGGSPVTVPVGLIESSISTTNANEQARSLGLSLMDCFWFNVEKTADCPTLELEDGTDLPPHASSPVITSLVPVGEILSRISQEAADEEAQTRADLLLRCIYCNLQIDPECLPADVVNPTIPIPPGDVQSYWSIDATLGVAEATFCGEDGTVQPLAETVNFPAAQTEGACAYENDEVVAGCIEDVPGGVVGLFAAGVGADLSDLSRPNPHDADPTARTLTLAAGIVSILDINVPGSYLPADPQRYKKWANHEAERLALTLLNCFFGNDEYLAECPLDAEGNGVHGTATATATVPKDFFQSYSSKAEADAQAVSYGESLLNCFWMNEEIITTCILTNPSDDEQYHEAAITEVVVAADTYPSDISLANANFIAGEIANSGLSCLYTNIIQQPDDCPEGTTDYGSFPVDAGVTVSNISGADADLQAKALANASRTCLDPVEVGGQGEPGADGAQTGCSGDCYGYFS